MLLLIDQHLQGLSIHRFDLIVTGLVQLQHPLQDVVLFHEVSRVDRAELVPVEGQGRQTGQVVLLLDTLVGGLHKVNALLLTLVIDVLDLIDDLLALLISLAI